ncbi:MAG: pilus assembly protein N-terminal domain-containing protein [Planctomycetaceae bacterium]|nr:pilus assembly protein N-terminal domain-containing protein [Planctomycetaceae bacterium]
MVRRMVQFGSVAFLFSLAAVAANDPQVNRELKPAERKTVTTVTLRKGEPRSLQTKNGLRFLRVAGFDPKVLDVRGVKADVIALTGQSVGRTHMIVTDEKDQREELIVVVESDSER